MLLLVLVLVLVIVILLVIIIESLSSTITSTSSTLTAPKRLNAYCHLPFLPIIQNAADKPIKPEYELSADKKPIVW
jgi:hypothetical protein